MPLALPLLATTPLPASHRRSPASPSPNSFPMMSHSGAARAGVENLTRTLSVEWCNAGVRINCVAPGVIYSDSGMANYGAMADTLIEGGLPTVATRLLL